MCVSTNSLGHADGTVRLYGESTVLLQRSGRFDTSLTLIKTSEALHKSFRFFLTSGPFDMSLMLTDIRTSRVPYIPLIIRTLRLLPYISKEIKSLQ